MARRALQYLAAFGEGRGDVRHVTCDRECNCPVIGVDVPQQGAPRDDRVENYHLAIVTRIYISQCIVAAPKNRRDGVAFGVARSRKVLHRLRQVVFRQPSEVRLPAKALYEAAVPIMGLALSIGEHDGP